MRVRVRDSGGRTSVFGKNEAFTRYKYVLDKLVLGTSLRQCTLEEMETSTSYLVGRTTSYLVCLVLTRY